MTPHSQDRSADASLTARLLVGVGLFVAALVCGCIPTPEDSLAFGELCVPAEGADCPKDVVLTRDAVGRNQLDYTIYNEGEQPAQATVLILVPSAEPRTDATSDGGESAQAPSSIILRREYPPIEPGESIGDRLTPQDLGVRTSIRVALACDACQVRMEWVFMTVPLECFESEDCAAGWFCDSELRSRGEATQMERGRCVECLGDGDCNEDQLCDEREGRCTPPESNVGCQSADAAPGFGSFVLFLLVFLASRTARAGTRGLRWRRPELPSALLLLALAVWPAEAAASPPRASISIATGARFITGELGQYTHRGVGFGIGQELRWRYIGAGLNLSTAYYLTTQNSPPFSHSLQTYGLTLGPRGYLPFGKFEIAAGPDYRRLGLANNSLVRITGPRTSYDAAGGSLGLRFRWSGLEVRLEGAGHSVFGLPGIFWSADLAVGLTGTL